jgi:hypothetical protein
MPVNPASHKFKMIPEHNITQEDRDLWEALFARITERDLNILYSLYFAAHEAEIYIHGFNSGSKQTLQDLVVLEQQRLEIEKELSDLTQTKMGPSATMENNRAAYRRNRDTNSDRKNQTRFR